ncbi:MAG: hypothetical protein ACOYMN_06105 [Roseimicrobium sp.]
MSATSLTSNQPWWQRAWRWCFAIEPMAHAWWETLIMRGVIAWATLITLWHTAPFTSQPQPHGLAAWGADFTWLGNGALTPSLRIVLGVSLVLYVCRVLPALTLLPALVASFGLGVLGNSQGAIGHATQIVTTVLLLQWLAYAWALLRPCVGRSLPQEYNGDQLAADWARQGVAATYVVSAISKLIESEGNWIADTPYFGLQIVKSNNMGFYDWLAPRTEGFGAAAGQWFVDHPWMAMVLFGAALPLELFAFIGLHNRRAALAFGVALFGFHSIVTEFMQLGFLYHKMLLVALFVNPAWWLVQGAKRIFAAGWRGRETPA